MIQIFSPALVFASITLFSGCATTMQIAPEKRAAIDTVTLSDRVLVTDKPQFIGGIGHLVAPGIGGAIGGMIDAVERDKDQQYIAFLKDAGIDVASIIKSAFEAQQRWPRFFGHEIGPV